MDKSDKLLGIFLNGGHIGRKRKEIVAYAEGRGWRGEEGRNNKHQTFRKGDQTFGLPRHDEISPTVWKKIVAQVEEERKHGESRKG